MTNHATLHANTIRAYLMQWRLGVAVQPLGNFVGWVRQDDSTYKQWIPGLDYVYPSDRATTLFST